MQLRHLIVVLLAVVGLAGCFRNEAPDKPLIDLKVGPEEGKGKKDGFAQGDARKEKPEELPDNDPHRIALKEIKALDGETLQLQNEKMKLCEKVLELKGRFDQVDRDVKNGKKFEGITPEDIRTVLRKDAEKLSTNFHALTTKLEDLGKRRYVKNYLLPKDLQTAPPAEPKYPVDAELLSRMSTAPAQMPGPLNLPIQDPSRIIG